MRSLLSLCAGMAVLTVTTAQAGLIHHYTFDDADIVGTKGAGDIVGSADATPIGTNGGNNIATGQPGVFGQAFQFTRDSEGTALAEFENLLTAPAGTAPTGSAERTISLWFSQTVDTNGQDKLFGYGTNSGGQALDISLEAGGIRLRHFGGNITYGGGSFDFDDVDAGFHHLAVRVNAGAATFSDVDIFLDGVQLSITATGGGGTGVAIDTVDSIFGIGTTSIVPGNAAIQGFTGLLDELRIYDNAISDAEIRTLAIPEPTTGGLLLAAVALVAVFRKR